MIDIVASRYAEALFQVGEEDNKTDNLYQELKAVVDILNDNNDFYGILKSPIVAKGEKRNLAISVFSNQISEEMLNFLKILIDKDRVNAIGDIEKSLKQLLNDKNNIVEGTVISAVPMKEDEVKELETQLSKKYNKTVILTNEIDKSILGGLLVRLGNEEINGTVKNRLDKMKDTLSQVIS